MKKLASITIVLIGLVSGSAAVAAKRCPANDMGCTPDNYEEKYKERIEQGKEDVRNASGPVEKAKAVGNTIKDCADCGMKVIKDSISGGDASK